MRRASAWTRSWPIIRWGESTVAQERAELLIALRDELSSKLTKIDQRVSGLNKTVASGAQTRDKYRQDLKRMGAQALAATGVTAGLAGAVMGLRRAWSLAFEGLEANRVEAAFIQAAGGADAAAAAMERLRSASGGALDDTSLQAFTNKTVRMGMEVDDAYAIMKLARQEAIKTGEDELALANSLQQAAATGRQQSLQAQGILLDNVALERDHARTLGKTRAELTKLEQIQARRGGALQRIRDLGRLSSEDISRLETARTGWENFMSAVSQGWERALDPIAAARREGAALVAEFDPLTTQAVAQVERLQEELETARDKLDAAKRTVESPWSKAAGPDAFGDDVRAMERAQADLASVATGVSTQAMRLLALSNKLGGEVANALETSRAVLDKGLTPDQLMANREVLEAYTDQYSRLLTVAEAFDGGPGEVLQKILGDQLTLLQEEADQLRTRADLLDQARGASVEAYRAQARELQELKARGATLGTEEIARLKLLEQLTATYKGHNVQLLQVVGTVQELRGVSAKLIPDLDVGAQARLDEAHRRLKVAQDALTAALKSGDVEDARVALVNYRASADGVTTTLRAAGVASETLNAYLRDTGRQAAYAEERVSAYQRSLSAMVFDELAAGAAELLKKAGNNETVQAVLGGVEDTYKTILLMGIKARKAVVDEMNRIAADARDKGPAAVEPVEVKPQDVSPWDAEELRIMEDQLQGRKRIIAEHWIAIQRLLLDHEEGRITVAKYGVEADKLRAQKRAELNAIELQELQRAQDLQRELELEQINREHRLGELTDYAYDVRVLDLDRRYGMIDEQIAAERRLTLAMEEELRKREELYQRLEDGVQSMEEGVRSALSNYQTVASTFTSDNRLDQAFVQRANLMSTAGASALRAIVTSTKGTVGETGAALSTMTNDLGMALAAFDKDAKRAALKMAIFAGASAIIAGVTHQYEKAVGYLAASAMYGSIAGGAGASKPRSQRASRPAIATSAGATRGGRDGGISLTVVYNSGMAVATKEALGEEIMDAVNAAAYSVRKIDSAAIGA